MTIVMQAILMKETITVVGQGGNEAAIAADRNNKKVVFKNCAPFTDCNSEMNNTQIDNAKDLDIVMQIHHLIEYSDNYAKQIV